MLLHLFYALVFSMSFTSHTSHGSLLNMEYKDHKWHAELTVDVEHFEEALEARFKKDIRIEEAFRSSKVPESIQTYISETISFTLGKKAPKNAPLEDIYLKNGTAHFVFKPIRKRFKTNYIWMTNSFMLEYIKDQKNLVKISYKGNDYSMLFTQENQEDSVELQQ
jgi:hypothetical protein